MSLVEEIDQTLLAEAVVHKPEKSPRPGDTVDSVTYSLEWPEGVIPGELDLGNVRIEGILLHFRSAKSVFMHSGYRASISGATMRDVALRRHDISPPNRSPFFYYTGKLVLTGNTGIVVQSKPLGKRIAYGVAESTTFPARFAIGSAVSIRQNESNQLDGYIRTVTFTEGKVRYSVRVPIGSGLATLHNIDSTMIEERDAPAIEMPFDNYS